MIDRSVLKHNGPMQDECACTYKVVSAPEQLDARPMLFVSETCPNCAMAESVLNKAGVEYDELMASQHLDMINKYGVNQAPTLVIDRGGAVETYKGVSEIIGWCRK